LLNQIIRVTPLLGVYLSSYSGFKLAATTVANKKKPPEVGGLNCQRFIELIERSEVALAAIYTARLLITNLRCSLHCYYRWLKI
jgi:hypothetical protein